MGVCGEGIQRKAVVNRVSVNTRFLFGHQFSNQSEKYLGLQLQDDGEPIFRFIKNCRTVCYSGHDTSSSLQR